MSFCYAELMAFINIFLFLCIGIAVFSLNKPNTKNAISRNFLAQVTLKINISWSS